MQVAEILDAAKKAQGFQTDMALAKGLGVSRSAVSSWRHGVTTPDTIQCATLAGYTGMPLAKVLGIVGEARAISREEKAVWRKLAATAAVTLCAIGLSIGGNAKAAQGKAFEDMAPDSHVSNAYYVKKRRQRGGPLRRLVWIWLWIKSCLPQRDHPTDTEIAA